MKTKIQTLLLKIKKWLYPPVVSGGCGTCSHPKREVYQIQYEDKKINYCKICGAQWREE